MPNDTVPVVHPEAEGMMASVEEAYQADECRALDARGDPCFSHWAGEYVTVRPETDVQFAHLIMLCAPFSVKAGPYTPLLVLAGLL